MPAKNSSTKPKGRKLRSAKPSSNVTNAPALPSETAPSVNTNTERPASPSMRDTRSFAAVVNGTPPSSPAAPLAERALPSRAKEEVGHEVTKETRAPKIDEGETIKTPLTAIEPTQDTVNTEENGEAGVAADKEDVTTATKGATGGEPQDGASAAHSTQDAVNEPVQEALHQSVRRRRTSTKGKGKETSTSKEGTEATPASDEDLRASDAARKRRRLSTTPTPSDKQRTPSNVEMRVQRAPQTPLTDHDGDIAMEEKKPGEEAMSGAQEPIPSPSAASSDFLWGSLGEIDPEVLALLNASDSEALSIFQGDPNAPSIFKSQDQGNGTLPGPSNSKCSEGNPPPRWLTDAGTNGSTEKQVRPREEDDIFRPEPIRYEEPNLFTRVTRNMRRAAAPAPKQIQYIRRNLLRASVDEAGMPTTQPEGTNTARSDTPRPPQPRPVPLAIAPPKLPSFRRHPTNPGPDQSSLPSGQRQATTSAPSNRAAPVELDDISDPLLHLDDLIEDFDPSPAPVENAYEVTLPTDARKWVQNTNPYWKEKDMGDEQKRLWSQNKGPAILIHFPGCGTSDPSIGEKINLTRLDLSERFGVDGNSLRFLIAHAKNPHNHPNREPFFIIVFGLTEDQCNELIEKVWHSSKRVTFGVEPREPRPSWLVAIYVHYERFLDPTEKGMARAFMRIFLQRENQKFIMNLINRDIQRGGRWHGRANSVKEAFGIFIKSVETHLIRRQITGGIDEPLVAMYAEPPTDDPEDWIAFRNHIQSQRVGSELTGFPELYKQWVYCQLCHSRDHFVGLCPVPRYPGWEGPKSADITEKRAPDRDQDRDHRRSQAPRGNVPNATYAPPGTQQRPPGRLFNGSRGNGRGNDGDYRYYEY